MEREIQAKFKGTIKFILKNNRKHIVSSAASLENVNMKWVNEENTNKSAALLLRRNILNIEKTKIYRNVKVNQLIERECQVPQILIDFFCMILTGGNTDKVKNPRILLVAKSLAQDVIYAVHRGKIKTSKHTTTTQYWLCLR